MRKFAVVKRFNENEIELPERKTALSAGYDFEVAEDIVIPCYKNIMREFDAVSWTGSFKPLTLDEVATVTKKHNLKPTLVPTGVKVYLEDDDYLELSVRSSCPLKHWLILANGVGIIDQDYADNIDNDGEIYFQVINLSSFDIQLKKGDILGQGIIKKYLITDNDKANGVRTGGFGSTSTVTNELQENIDNNISEQSLYDALQGIKQEWIALEDDNEPITFDHVYAHTDCDWSPYTTTPNKLVTTLGTVMPQISFSAAEVGTALSNLSKALKGITNND